MKPIKYIFLVMIMNKYLEFLNQNITLSSDEVQLLNNNLNQKHFQKGETIHHCEHIHDGIYFIESGTARGYYIDENGKDTTWYIYFNDENSHLTNLVVFDYDSYLNQTPSKLHFEALSDCSVWIMKKKDIEYLCSQYLKWSEFMRRSSDMAYSLVHQKYFTQLVQNAEERFAEFLIKTPYLLHKVPQYHIASYLGITPQHLSRLKKINKCK
ncbi:putative Cyclic nucleotide-binding protein [Sulfurovum sp. enrichment culture clone C5]|uniref:Putative Cyclic nucleotide-binding protein n=1 Tax=Sulfurovum sp. enrichment culture clone C5 TaxID=497650 RepID=A0A0S4XQ34_9BACT|nr:putative Cyclic nucleotide-binding protein [Sulfurovum sp. enrichment culture clone C5]